MSHGKVRLRYSGFVLFVSRILSIGTGLVFTVMVTRNISVEEFGIYSNLTDVLFYFTVATAVIPFWTTRFIARGHSSSSKTGLTANLLLSLLSFAVYLSLLPTILSIFQIDREYLPVYIVAAFYLIEAYTIFALEAILQAGRPHILGFGFSVFEASKVALGFILIMLSRLGLIGVVATVVLASLLQVLFYIIMILRELREEVRWDYVKEWLKASPLNFYSIISQRLLAFSNIFLFVYGGELARAYYGAALMIAQIVGYSSLLAYALYPRLLYETRSEDIFVSTRMVLMFVIPMTIGAVILSDSFLGILNPLYNVARPALIILSVNSLLLTLSSIFDAIVSGTEELDAEAKITYRGIVRSRLFLYLTLPYIQAAAVVPLTYLVLTSMVKDAIGAVVSLALITLAGNTAITIARYAMARRCLHFDVPWRHALRYLGASVLMASVLCLIPPPTRILTTVGATLLGGCVYFVALSAIDKESRDMARAAMQELLRMLRIAKA